MTFAPVPVTACSASHDLHRRGSDPGSFESRDKALLDATSMAEGHDLEGRGTRPWLPRVSTLAAQGHDLHGPWPRLDGAEVTIRSTESRLLHRRQTDERPGRGVDGPDRPRNRRFSRTRMSPPSVVSTSDWNDRRRSSTSGRRTLGSTQVSPGAPRVRSTFTPVERETAEGFRTDQDGAPAGHVAYLRREAQGERDRSWLRHRSGPLLAPTGRPLAILGRALLLFLWVATTVRTLLQVDLILGCTILKKCKEVLARGRLAAH
jgi:hypothetical protein